MTSREIHPFANTFPMMSEPELQDLAKSIADHGQHEPVVLWRGLLIDGRNRLKACEIAGVEPSECELEDESDAVAYILAANVYRRHLLTSQRSMIAAKLATLKKGQKKSRKARSYDLPQEDAARRLNVSVPSVKRAKTVVDRGSAELVGAVERGEITVANAAALVSAVASKPDQTRLLSKGKQAITAAIKAKTRPKKQDAAKSTPTGSGSPTEGAVSYQKVHSDAEDDVENPCPNCGCTWWVPASEDGWDCDQCGHPQGEPVGDVDDGKNGWKALRFKAIKTCEALLRAIDDLHCMKANNAQHAKTISDVKVALATLKAW